MKYAHSVLAIFSRSYFKNGFWFKVKVARIDAPETSKRKNQPNQPFSEKAEERLAVIVLFDNDVLPKTGGIARYRDELADAM